MGLNVPWRFPSLSRSQPEARRGPGRAPGRRQTRTMPRSAWPAGGLQRHARRPAARAAGPGPGSSSGPASIWNLGTPISNVRHSISSVTFDIEDVDIKCSIDIEVFYIRYRISISKVFDIECHPTRYQRCKIVDIEGQEQGSSCRSRSFVFSISNIIIRYRALISYTISKDFLTIDIEYKSFDIEQCSIGSDIVYDIAFTQLECHSLQSGSSLCPGDFTPAPKGLSATSPGFLHPLFAQFHSLIHRDLTRKGPSIAPHPHVDFEQPAPSPVVGS